MNQPLLKLSWSILISAFLFTACSPDDDPAMPPSGNDAPYLLTQVVFAHQDTTIYTYDAQRRVIKAVFPADANGGSKFFKEYTYDAQGRLIKTTSKLMNGSPIGYCLLEYQNQKLNKISSFSRPTGTGDFTHDYDNLLEYNSAGQVIKLMTQKPNDPSYEHRHTNFVYNAAGDVIRTEDFVNKQSGLVNDYIADYTYDDKINPHRAIDIINLGPTSFSSHNVLTQKETYPISGQVKSTNHHYTYNLAGYPVKEIRTSNTNTFEIENSYLEIK